jgi:NitT/TauT family transport system permease protein/taurine transport system permease protein
VIPAAIPAILEGVRIGGALTIVGVVIAEMLVSAAGVGYLITRYRALLDSAHVFAAILLVVAIVVGFDALVRLLERRTAVWRTARHLAADDDPGRHYATPTMA